MLSRAVDAFWSALARFIGRRPGLVTKIIRLAQRHPYVHIDGPGGDRYMSRWWLLRGRPSQDACPWWLRWCPIAIRIHHIRRPDEDRNPHDHPCDFRTVVLDGWYVERDIFGVLRHVGFGSSYSSRAERFHRITTVPDRGVWTLFILWRRRQVWGFLVDNRKVPWHEYLNVSAEVER